MEQHHKKETSYERILFFTDAVVAIAITLLALELRLESPVGHHITFSELLHPWHKYLAFILSFINIAGLWRTHHTSFVHINKMDERMMMMNTAWLFFIVTLPFSTSVLSDHFGDTPAIFLYSMNIFLLSVLQNFMWDYSGRKNYMSLEKLNEHEQQRMRWITNLDMINGLIAIIFSFFMPKLAFFLLFFKIPIFFAVMFMGAKRRQQIVKSEHRKKKCSRKRNAGRENNSVVNQIQPHSWLGQRSFHSLP